MPLILVVCTANICRSPVVEVLLRRKLHERGLTDWRVESAGTMGVSGWPPAAESVALVAGRGLDISEHRSSALTAERLAASDLVLCMEQAHVDAARRRLPSLGDRARRLAELADEPRDVRDPYGGPVEGFERMVAEVDDLLDRSLDRILETVSGSEEA